MPSKVKIYTRTGDLGQTSLYGGKRVIKSDNRVISYGNIDELNSALGVLLTHIDKEIKIRDFILTVQNDLFTIGAFLSGAKINMRILSLRVKAMEKQIDNMDQKLPNLKEFILPGGNSSAAWSHLSRSICRRSERKVVKVSSLMKTEKKGFEIVIRYLNRLSDLLFILARYLNLQSGVRDQVWQK